jgi:signal transduction histidine kinase
MKRESQPYCRAQLCFNKRYNGGEAGFGFGLALVKHLIESLKGTLNINSTPGDGSATFEVRLPQASALKR